MSYFLKHKGLLSVNQPAGPFLFLWCFGAILCSTGIPLANQLLVLHHPFQQSVSLRRRDVQQVDHIFSGNFLRSLLNSTSTVLRSGIADLIKFQNKFQQPSVFFLFCQCY